MKNADDHAVLAAVLQEVEKCYMDKGMVFDFTCCILPTAPLIQVEDLKLTYQKLRENNVDGIMPVVRFSYPTQRALKIINGNLEMIHPQFLRTRSQDLEPTYYDAGQFFWSKFYVNIETQQKLPFELLEIRVQDIDTEEDWKLAELKYKLI